MKKLAYFLFVLLIISNLSMAQSNETNRQTRMHQLIILNEQEQLEYTWIYNYEKENNEMKYSDLSVLVDLSKYGKWVFKRNLRKIDSSNYEVKKSFENLETKEALNISYNIAANSEPTQYTICSTSSDKKVTLKREEIAKEPKNFNDFVLSNFTKKYLEGLEKFKEIVFKIYNENISFQIAPYDFIEIWGFTKETDFKKSANKFPVVLYPNCDFDAKFGYPCSPEEVPSINPKILVIEKKQ
ncbi:MAG: hypothetical protein N2445_02085 [Acidobacteria bacterium]|nr:hypothetical protein [Acidobacteriota bacterium]